MNVEDEVRHMISDAMWSGLTSFPMLAQESGISEKRLRDMIDGTAPIFMNDVSDIFHALGLQVSVGAEECPL